ncbi:MAG: AEC family transporter [Bacteroidales bacterium]|jgi:predicted permease|nr:AEC family transporter [Bacteroidales bacterium]
MEDFLFSINAVAPLFILITAGYTARRINFVSDRFLSDASRFVFNFLLPLMLFRNIRGTFHGDFTNAPLIFTAVAGIGIVIILSSCMAPLLIKRRGQCGSMIQGIYRSNFLIYGMPLATGMYGQDAAHSIAMLMGVMIPFYNVAAVVILSVFSETRTTRLSLLHLLRDIARNPLIIGCVTGMLFGIFRIEMPVAISKPVSDLSAAASPLALFLMGGEFKFKSLNNNLWKVFSVTAARLVLVPLVAMLVFIPMGFRTIDLSVLLCIFATPAAVSSYIMAGNMGCDGELSGQIVVLTTVGSSLSIFLFVFVLRSIGVL